MEEKTFSLAFLSPEETEFSLSENGFLRMKQKNGESKRVIPSYAFPLEFTEGYISICDEEGEELGLVKSLAELPEEGQRLLQQELARRYYCPKLKKILSIKNKAGLSLWNCITGEGENITVTVKDAYKSMIRVSDRRMFLVDRDGARYEIEDCEALDKKSFHKLELYL